MKNKTFIIAEAGVNHNGSIELAKELIDVAASAGADAVKFQTFRTENNITQKAPKAEYQVDNTGSGETQFEMVKKLELDKQAHIILQAYSKQKNITFLSTAFDLESVDLLHELRMPLMKIPSGEINNPLLIRKIASKKLDMILSTGMATLGDIEMALGIIAFELLDLKVPTITNFKKAYNSKEGQEILKSKVSLLHCTTEYPAPYEDINLRAMITMKNAFGLKVGYSDHSKGITVPIAAVALGAEIIEKHFTLDKTLPGPDHKASLEPDELKAMIKGIRETELSLGISQKTVTPSEEKNIAIARRSLVAKQKIEEGDVFTEENLGIMRPGDGIPAINYYDYLGKTANRNYDFEDKIVE